VEALAESDDRLRGVGSLRTFSQKIENSRVSGEMSPRRRLAGCHPVHSLGAINGANRGWAGMGGLMDWARVLAYVTGTVDQELLLGNEYLAAENSILKTPHHAGPRSASKPSRR